MASKAQLWARKRNMFKGRIASMVGLTDHLLSNGDVLTSVETVALRVASATLKDIIRHWEKGHESSKERFIRRHK